MDKLEYLKIVYASLESYETKIKEAMETTAVDFNNTISLLKQPQQPPVQQTTQTEVVKPSTTTEKKSK